MKKLIGFLFATAALAAPLGNLKAEEMAFTPGETLNHMLAVCLDKADAVEIVKADAEKGFEAARAVFDLKARCAPVPVIGPKVGKVVYSAKVKRADGTATESVVEIVSEGKVEAYFITTSPVKSPVSGVDGKVLSLKPERNA